MKIQLTDLFEKFKEVIFSADKKSKPKDRRQFIQDEKQLKTFHDIFKAQEASKNIVPLGVILRILKEEFPDHPVPIAEFTPTSEICQGLETNKKAIQTEIVKFNFARAEQLYHYAGYGIHIEKYTDRHQFLETAIRLVMEQFEPDQVWKHKDPSCEDACKLIARCYLLRSKLVLHKGVRIPEKKREAIQYAWEWAEETSDNDLKIRIALEKDRWDDHPDNTWIKARLSDYIAKNPSPDSPKAIHWMVNDRAKSLSISGLPDNFDARIADADTEKVAGSDDVYMLRLLQAKAALRTDSPNLKEKIMTAVEMLDQTDLAHLSHHLWDDTIDMLEITASKPEFKGQWEEAAIRAWELCMEQESKIKLDIQIRWYWERHQKLYELAFQAALNNNDKILAAQIADSLKNRPMRKLQDIEKSLSPKNKEAVTKYIQNISMNPYDFVHGMSTRLLKKTGEQKTETRCVSQIPKGWAVVHFFLPGQDQCHIIILYEGNQEYRTINIANLWKAYRNWEADYRKASDIENTEHTLNILCDASGQVIKEMILPVIPHDIENILLIPHGFLHRIPLHAAKIGNGYLFQEKNCLFLPAWSLMPVEPSEAVQSEDKIFLSNWENSKDIKPLIKLTAWSYKAEHVETKCFFEALQIDGTPPRLLAIYSHGTGNFMNPYLSGLVMKEKLLTHEAIIKGLPPDALKGTKVMLTACETDFVQKNLGQCDEHLSLASAFLRRGASEVIGSLFIAIDVISKELIECASSDDRPLYEILREKQVEWAAKETPLYKMAAFRVMGYPK